MWKAAQVRQPPYLYSLCLSLLAAAAAASNVPLTASAEPAEAAAAAAEKKPAIAKISPFEQIAAAFEDYRNAVVNDDGQKAARFVTRQIFDYFGKVRDWALYADKQRTQNLPFTDQVTVLRLRAATKPDELAASSGKALFIRSVQEGWLEKEYLQKVELGETQVDEKAKTALLVQNINGHRAPGLIEFQREKRRWKLNAYSLLLGSSFVFEHSLRTTKTPKEELIRTAMAGIAGREFDPAWWEPLRKTPKGKKLEELGLDTALPQQIPFSRPRQN